MTELARPLLLGHRGVRPIRGVGLHAKQTGVPAENTLAAFEYCMAAGCDGFEFDVRSSADSRQVLCHDSRFNRMEIVLSTYDELCGGGSLAVLEDMLHRYGGTAWLDIELKVPGREEAVVAALRDAMPQRGFVVSSFLPEILERLHDIEPALPLGYICDDARRSGVYKKLPLAWFIPHCRLVSPALIEETHARGLQIMTWTVNRERDLRRLAGWGVDALISDDPALLSATFGQAGR